MSRLGFVQDFADSLAIFGQDGDVVVQVNSLVLDCLAREIVALRKPDVTFEVRSFGAAPFESVAEISVATPVGYVRFRRRSE